MILKTFYKRIFSLILAILLILCSPYINILNCDANVLTRSTAILGVWDPDDLTDRVIPVRNDLGGYSTNVSNSMARWNSVRSSSNSIILTFALVTYAQCPNYIISSYNLDPSSIAYCDNRVSNGYIYEFILYLNHDYSYSVGAVSGKYDIETVLTHELGHALGVPHCHEKGASYCPSSSCSSDVMNPYISTGVTRRTLTSYDKLRYRTLYD